MDRKSLIYLLIFFCALAVASACVNYGLTYLEIIARASAAAASLFS